MATRTNLIPGDYEIGHRAMSRSEIEQRLQLLQERSPEVEEAVLLLGGLSVLDEVEAATREAAESEAEADELVAAIRVGPSRSSTRGTDRR